MGTPKLSNAGKEHIEDVMRLFAKRQLRDSSGKTVTSKEQALAIAHAEVRAMQERGATVRTWRGRTRLRPKLSK